MKPHFVMFAAYNRWANQLVYAAAARLSDADYRADRGAFFRSVHGTLNHLLVADRIWMGRFTNAPSVHRRLDEILYDDLAALSAAREAQDRAIVEYVDGLAEDELAGTITFTPVTNPIAVTQPLAPALAHFFNHQTHHRGQVHALITGLSGRDAGPAMDLSAFQRQSGLGLN